MPDEELLLVRDRRVVLHEVESRLPHGHGSRMAGQLPERLPPSRSLGPASAVASGEGIRSMRVDAGREPDLRMGLGQCLSAPGGVEVRADGDNPVHSRLACPLEDRGEVAGERVAVQMGVGIHQHAGLSYHRTPERCYFGRPGIWSVVALTLME